MRVGISIQPHRVEKFSQSPRSNGAALEEWMADPKSFFEPTLILLERGFRQLEAKVPPPVRMPSRDSFVFRYVEQTIHQAIVQKLARTLSGLHAVQVLLERGLFQEQGMMQRALDEIEEDVWFLALAVIKKDVTPRHTEYLRYFYEEEFEDPQDIVGSHKSRGMVKREKIRAYVNSASGAEAARANAVGKVLAKAYSGFIHAASPQIMDMYGGLPAQFDVSGKFRNWRAPSQERDALNYFYRAVLAMAAAAKAFSDDELFTTIRAWASDLDAAMR
jgi:hypothetical protein